LDYVLASKKLGSSAAGPESHLARPDWKTTHIVRIQASPDKPKRKLAQDWPEKRTMKRSPKHQNMGASTFRKVSAKAPATEDKIRQ
jgi:hypothetical protein